MISMIGLMANSLEIVIKILLFILLISFLLLSHVINVTRSKFTFDPYYPNFEFFHKNVRFGVFLSVDNYFTFKNSRKYVLMVPLTKILSVSLN